MASGVLVAPPAQARWTAVGSGTDFRICKATTANGKAWRFRARVSKLEGVEDARVGVQVWRRNHRRDQWRSGWLADDEVERGRVRIRKSPLVRVVVSEMAGDTASPIGVASQSTVFRAKQIKRC